MARAEGESMRETAYANELKTAADIHGQRIERLYVKEKKRDEIRFSWWPEGRMANRPLDIPEDELLALMADALAEGVFSEKFTTELLVVIAQHLDRQQATR